MKSMSDYIAKLESYTDLEVSIMRATKIHKVLRAIVKLASIPRDGEFEFKKRSADVLAGWNRLLQADEQGDDAGKANGVKAAAAAAGDDDAAGNKGAAEEKDEKVEKKAEVATEEIEKKVEDAGEKETGEKGEADKAEADKEAADQEAKDA